MHRCSECGAEYANPGVSCPTRFDELLALDHSREEPWGSRHGQAFAAYALQHPRTHAASLDRAWVALYAIYVLNEEPLQVFEVLRRTPSQLAARLSIPPRPEGMVQPPEITIATLGDFASNTYPRLLDSWCRATLAAWGVARVAA